MAEIQVKVRLGLLFKHNTFRMWGYFGYEEGFIGYASSKYKNAADVEERKYSDEFIIQKFLKVVLTI